tara:strand:+ start:256 stop:417 length:162 start_codon:yes stop_codon:yes gene_type:complete
MYSKADLKKISVNFVFVSFKLKPPVELLPIFGTLSSMAKELLIEKNIRKKNIR